VIKSKNIADFVILVVLQIYLVHFQDLAPDLEKHVLIIIILIVSVEAVVRYDLAVHSIELGLAEGD
jgi:hypothetical protein